MAEPLKISRNVERLVEQPGFVQVNYFPTNEGVEDFVMHGQTLKLIGTATQTADAYEPTAKDQIFNVLEAHFPGIYSRGT